MAWDYDQMLVKVGRGSDPKRRMEDYCKAYHIKPGKKHLYYTPVCNSHITEMELHEQMRKVGFEHYRLKGSNELFRAPKGWKWTKIRAYLIITTISLNEVYLAEAIDQMKVNAKEAKKVMGEYKS